MDCPNEKVLSSYLDERISGEERRNIEKHISECRHCLELLLVAYEVGHISTRCPPLLKERIKKDLGIIPKKARSELKWVFGALVLFTLSFIFKRYFIQLLVASAVLGFKWAMEGEGAKRAIMIFRGMKSGDSRPSKNFGKGERKSRPPVSI
jgi:hypothetical protein